MLFKTILSCLLTHLAMNLRSVDLYVHISAFIDMTKGSDIQTYAGVKNRTWPANYELLDKMCFESEFNF